MVGKYVDLADSYKSLNEALIHAGIHTRSKVNVRYVDSEALGDADERAVAVALTGVDGVLSNNYGPHQFPEKLIPLLIHHALAGKPLPVYGDGLNVRDWLYVEDHCAALREVLARGRPGEVYNIGGGAEMKNIDLVKTLCALLDDAKPRTGGSYASLVTFVKDRPGHDRRYAIDSGKIQRELGWRPQESFESGLRKTVRWTLERQLAIF